MIDPRPLWDFDDPAASGERFLDVAEHADEPDRTAWLTQYARALGLAGRYDEAHQVLDQLASDDPQAATYLDLERGRVLNSSVPAEQARPLFESAARNRCGRWPRRAARGRPAHGGHRRTGGGAARRQRRALEVARASSDQRARDWDASLLNNIGMTYADAGDFEHALPDVPGGTRGVRADRRPGRIRIGGGWSRGPAQPGPSRRSTRDAAGAQAGARPIGEADPYVDEELALLAD